MLMFYMRNSSLRLKQSLAKKKHKKKHISFACRESLCVGKYKMDVHTVCCINLNNCLVQYNNYVLVTCIQLMLVIDKQIETFHVSECIMTLVHFIFISYLKTFLLS